MRNVVGSAGRGALGERVRPRASLGVPFLILEEHFAIGYLLDTTLHVERDAFLLHLLAQAFGDVAVEGGQALLQVFDHRHL